jgi:hypothetical protein
MLELKILNAFLNRDRNPKTKMIILFFSLSHADFVFRVKKTIQLVPSESEIFLNKIGHYRYPKSKIFNGFLCEGNFGPSAKTKKMKE